MLDMLEDLRKIDTLALRCVRHQTKFMGRQAWSPGDMFQEARSAILECLAHAYAGGGEVTELELRSAASRELGYLCWEFNKNHGGRNASAYWMAVADGDGIDFSDGLPPRTRTFDDPFSPRLVELMALGEVFPRLSQVSQEALIAYGLHDCHLKPAAEHLCVSEEIMRRRVHAARREFFDIWFDWEATPALPPLSKRRANLATHCGKGHEFTPENVGVRRLRSGTLTRHCIKCRDAGNARYRAIAKAKKEAS